jgi:flavin-dependent dehydrogenase
VVARAARWLSFELGESVEVRCHRAELHLLRAGLQFSVSRDAPLVYMTMRSALDEHLALRAAAAGAHLRAPCELKALEVSSGSVTLATTCGPVSARFALGCDGVASLVARTFGVDEPARSIPACEWEVYVGERALQRFGPVARFDFGISPAGYAWAFPKADHLSVGVLQRRRGSLGCRPALHRYLQQLGVAEVEHIQRHGYALPDRPRVPAFAGGRVLLAGDAAGLVDPLLWEGISYAVRSGQLAADAIVAADFQPAAAMLAYVRGLRREVVSEMSLARILSRLMYDHPGIAHRLFRRHGNALCAAMGKVISGEASYRSLLSKPMHYARLLLPVSREA